MKKRFFKILICLSIICVLFGFKKFEELDANYVAYYNVYDNKTGDVIYHVRVGDQNVSEDMLIDVIAREGNINKKSIRIGLLINTEIKKQC